MYTCMHSKVPEYAISLQIFPTSLPTALQYFQYFDSWLALYLCNSCITKLKFTCTSYWDVIKTHGYEFSKIGKLICNQFISQCVKNYTSVNNYLCGSTQQQIHIKLDYDKYNIWNHII